MMAQTDPLLSRRFSMIAFDWDGTAVANRLADAAAARAAIERLLTLGVLVVVVTGTHRGHLDRQFANAVPAQLRHRLYLATNRGSEVYGYSRAGAPLLLWSRKATSAENDSLTAISLEVQRTLGKAGLEIGIVSDRLNRRKLDLIPTPEWADPPKSEIGNLLKAVEARLAAAGLRDGLRGAFELTRRISIEKGLSDPRITTDVKHIEVGLTDKSDAMNWILQRLAWEHGIDPSEILVAGDEFGPIAGFPGSDSLMQTPEFREAVFISVGTEPGGIPPGVEHFGGGPDRFLELLNIIATRLEQGLAPALPAGPHTDPSWVVSAVSHSPARELETESLLAIANGYVGTRGTLFERPSALGPGTMIAGVFDMPAAENAVPALVAAPDWVRLRVELLGEEDSGITDGSFLDNVRTLDLRRGLFWREFKHQDPQNRITSLRGFRLASIKDRHLLMQSVELKPVNYSGKLRVEAEVDLYQSQHTSFLNPYPTRTQVAHDPERAPGDPIVVTYSYKNGGKIAFASTCRLVRDDGTVFFPWISRVHDRVAEYWEFDVELDRTYRIDRLVAVYTTRETAKPAHAAADHLKRSLRQGTQANVRAHLDEWKRHWQMSNIEIDGDAQAQRAVRFACYHLLSAANPEDEKVSIGARALTGNSYLGHVFWDTEIFMLPFFTCTAPELARSLLLYRYHTLPGARQNARDRGFEGALYAWESTDTGLETTPSVILSPTGEKIRVLTGEQEHHITADVAYAVWQYFLATGDEDFLAGPGIEILVETARFWASRAKLGPDGAYHLGAIIGPDEYHEDVSDNAFTNEMARWNLRRALEALSLVRSTAERLALRPGEPERWVEIAEKLARAREVDGVWEQFDGYFGLENLTATAQNQPGGADFRIFLNLERLGKTQLIKQADIVMLLHLLWDQIPENQRQQSFDYYEARTLHGSSLSPAIYALVAARLGRMDTALRYFKMASEIDLFNNMGNASGGIHAAAQGGLWQAVVFGFAGMSLRADEVAFSPRLPRTWTNLRFHVLWRGQPLAVHLSANEVEIISSGWKEVPVRIGTSPVVTVPPGETRKWALPPQETTWREESVRSEIAS
ncbi:MAG: glycoside hydrolase family 65 protein [Oligoflexia bacterium]|nr:glycoside hydrolase family 65 protein [Oligoflexia bacterium]